jgi:hypothetical protein
LIPVGARKEFWVITSYFNPCGYETRRRNFELFRAGVERAGVPLLAVECAFGRTPFALGRSRGVVRVRGRSVMWQKERLLNVALSRLPTGCRKVAWVDCDVLFENGTWAAEAADALDEVPVVQLFDRVVRLPPGESADAGSGHAYAGFVSRYLRDPSAPRLTDFDAHGHTGFAWAARRELLERHGLYDACVAGSGDHVMAHALCGAGARDGCVRRTLGRATPHLRHFAEWCRRLRRDVRGRVGFVPGKLLHLWHGDKRNRRYLGRNRRLAAYGFDPARDLRLNPTGCWEWASDKPELRRWLVEYFEGREEDGARRRRPLASNVGDNGRREAAGDIVMANYDGAVDVGGYACAGVLDEDDEDDAVGGPDS